MSTEDLSNLVALETIWKLGFSIVAKRIGEWLDTKGVKHNFETVDVPPGTRINHLRTDFRRRWERLPVEWQLPEIGQMVGFKVGEYVDPETGETKDRIGGAAFLPWAINGADLGWENYIDAYVSERGRQSQTAEWYDENVRQSLEESYRWWIGFFDHCKAKLTNEDFASQEGTACNPKWIVWIGDDMRLRRAGFSESIDLSSQSVLRYIAHSLVARRGNVVEDIDLQHPDDERDLEPGTIRGYITRLKKLVEPLGIKIERVRETGYRLSLKAIPENTPAQR